MFKNIDLNFLRNNKILIYNYKEMQNVINGLDYEGFIYDKRLYFDFYKFMTIKNDISISIDKLYAILYGEGNIKLSLYETYVVGNSSIILCFILKVF